MSKLLSVALIYLRRVAAAGTGSGGGDPGGPGDSGDFLGLNLQTTPMGLNLQTPE